MGNTLPNSAVVKSNTDDMAGPVFKDTTDMAGPVFKDTTDGTALVSATTRFAVELYKEQVKGSDGNLFISPISISAALSMTYLGARGNTMEEMKKTLCFDALEDAKLHQAFGELTNHLNKRCKDVQMANRLYGEESFKFLKEFQSACRGHYDAELVPVSFQKNPDKAIEKINNWVEKNTNGKIKDIFAPGSLDNSTVLVLVNAIYFKANWLQKFEKSCTCEADFFVSKDKTTKVQLMRRKVNKANYYYSRDLSCQVLQLPYKSGAMSMFVFLPDKKSSSLEELETKLTGDHLVNVDSEFEQQRDVDLSLPKFKMEETLELKEILADMGMQTLFNPRSADLSGMDGTRQLSASKVVHKAFVEVNEEGTEAAAATAVVIVSRCAPRYKEPPVEFRADHPFLFFIREERSKAIVFLGRAIAPGHA